MVESFTVIHSLQAELLHTVIHFNSIPMHNEFLQTSAGTGLSYSFTDAKSCGPVTGTADVTSFHWP
jgi:hypothetical protein